jgi:hypothetical protein
MRPDKNGGAMSTRPRTAPPRSDDAERPWVVLVDGKEPGIGGRFLTRAGAAATARRLRAKGINARVAIVKGGA